MSRANEAETRPAGHPKLKIAVGDIAGWGQSIGFGMMAKLWKGVVATVDWTKKRVLFRCKEPSQGGSSEKEFLQVLSWDVLTRVTTPDRGLIPIQQLQTGQRIYADCVQDQDGRWVARAIEVLPISAPQGRETGAQTRGAKGGEGG